VALRRWSSRQEKRLPRVVLEHVLDDLALRFLEKAVSAARASAARFEQRLEQDLQVHFVSERSTPPELSIASV